jgi:hypothetical protein
VTEENPEAGGRRDLTDAELDALLASTDRELLEVIRDSVDLDEGIGQVAGAHMRALYRQLHEQNLPDDPPFDVEEGFRDLKERLAADAASFKSGAESLDEEEFIDRTMALIEAGSLGTPGARALRAEGKRILYGDSDPDMSRIYAVGEELAARRVTAGEAYERFLKAGCLPAGARLHVRLHSGQADDHER